MIRARQRKGQLLCCAPRFELFSRWAFSADERLDWHAREVID
jgi:hypothetical protein